LERSDIHPPKTGADSMRIMPTEYKMARVPIASIK
jgi:hypothetical protein